MTSVLRDGLPLGGGAGDGEGKGFSRCPAGAPHCQRVWLPGACVAQTSLTRGVREDGGGQEASLPNIGKRFLEVRLLNQKCCFKVLNVLWKRLYLKPVPVHSPARVGFFSTAIENILKSVRLTGGKRAIP